MNPKPVPPPTPGISLDDVYYILFRHKWLIVILSLASVTTAVLVRTFWPMPYQSDAKLLIKYVKETKPPEQTMADSQVTSPDSRGENIINSEIEILTSLDLANNVVDALTPAKILAKAGGGTNRFEAALLVRRGLAAGVTNKSDVIEISFSHPDPDMAQPILSEIIDTYLKRHNEIHRPEFNEFLTRETDTVRHKLDDNETQLREAKSKAGVISLEDSKKMLGEMTSKIQQEIYDSEVELAGYQEMIKGLQNLLTKPDAAAVSTNAAPSAGGAVPVPPARVIDYQKICDQLSSLQSQEQELLAKYTTNATQVRTMQAQVARAETYKKLLEDNYPGLIAMKPAETKGTAPAPTRDPAIVLSEQMIKSKALAARIQVLTNQLAEVRNNAAIMTGQEGTILQLQRDKDIEDAEFSYYSRRLEESRANEVLGPGNSNISLVESPTPPMRNLVKFNKIIAGILFGGLAFAIGLPFVIELYLDRSLKRPLDVQARLGLPFFISIPFMNGSGSRPRALKGANKTPLLSGKTEETGEAVAEGGQSAPPANGQLALWEKSYGLQPFYETLRDRLMTYFEMINLTHKPKLVAVTSCSGGAGVTSTAAGLASSLSETGDGNVLLVNMNVRDGEAHHFYKGKLNCGLDEVFDKGARASAMVQDHLYVAKELPEDDRLPRVLPKRFNHLLPKMKASDFDYIIFDMPPVSQISITPKIARFMDMVLLVVESEKTDRDVASRAAAMLSATKTNVGIVLNKNRTYGLRRHHHDI